MLDSAISGFSQRWLAALLVLSACGGRSSKTTIPPQAVARPALAVGSCGTPEHDGVRNPQPSAVRLERADRDLNGDGQPELVAVDRSMCDTSGNCHWNVFTATSSSDPCQRFLGTVAGVALQVSTDASLGDQGFSPLRAFWQLGEGRVLVQSYLFSAGGYRVTDALVCNRAGAGGGDTLQCAQAVAK
jgi:hypothetical protein